MIQNTALAYDHELAGLLAFERERDEKRAAFKHALAARCIPISAASNDDDVDLDALLAPVLAKLAAEESARADIRTDPASAARSDKSVKAGRSVSVLCDAPFAYKLQAFAQDSIPALKGAGLVSYRGKTSSLSLSHPPHHANDNRDAELQAILDDLNAGVPDVTPARRFTRLPWFSYLPVETKRGRLPAWRFLSVQFKADLALYAAHKAAQDAGLVVYAFTVNFGDEVITKALAADRAADYIARKIGRNLKDRGIEPDTFLAIEDRVGRDVFDDRRLHGHGWLVADADQKDAVIEALAAAGGSYTPAHLQVRLDENPDAGWSTYCLKGLHWTRTVGRMHPSFAPSFNGSPIKLSASLRRRSEALFNEFRAHTSSDNNAKPKSCKTSYPSKLIYASSLRNTTYFTAPSNTVTPFRSTRIGELRKCIPSAISPTTASTVSWPFSHPFRPAPAARPSFAMPASATILSSSTRWTPPPPSRAPSPATSTKTASSSRLRTPAASWRSGWPWRSLRTRSATAPWSSRGPPEGRARPTTDQTPSAAGP